MKYSYGIVDREKILDLIIVKNERDQLKDQIRNLHRMLDLQENDIKKIDPKPEKDEKKVKHSKKFNKLIFIQYMG
jgi:hypothetical protein